MAEKEDYPLSNDCYIFPLLKEAAHGTEHSGGSTEVERLVVIMAKCNMVCGKVKDECMKALSDKEIKR